MIAALGDRVPLVAPDAYVAEGATVVGSVELGARASVWFGAVLRGDCDLITVGEESNIQDGAVLHADEGVPLTMGARVTVGHRAMLHGCFVEDEALIGIGAIVLNRARIGRHCIIGAAALIPEGKVIPERSLVVGVPGRVVRQLTDEEVASLRDSAAHYVEQARRFRESLRRL